MKCEHHPIGEAGVNRERAVPCQSCRLVATFHDSAWCRTCRAAGTVDDQGDRQTMRLGQQ